MTTRKFRIPGLQVPAGISGESLAFYNALKERLELLGGERGDPEQRSVTVRELREAGLASVTTQNQFARLARPRTPTTPTDTSTAEQLDISSLPLVNLASASGNLQLLLQGITTNDSFRMLLGDLLQLFARVDQETAVQFPWAFEGEPGFELRGSAPRFRFVELSEDSDDEDTRPDDENIWEVEVDDSELAIYLVNDDEDTRVKVLSLLRTGTTGDALNIQTTALQHNGEQVLVEAGTGLAKAGDTVSLEHLGLEDLTDPGADRLIGWIDADGNIDWIEIGDNLDLTAGVLSSTGGGGGGGSEFLGAGVLRTSAQSLPDDTSTAINFESEAFDEGDLWDIGADTRLTIADDGKYLVGATVSFDSNTTGKRQLIVRLNGTDVIATSEIPAAAGAESVCASIVVDLAATDYLELMVLQDSGGALDLVSATFYASLQNGSMTSHTHDASDIVSGTFADALIAESNVTQHEAALTIDYSQLTGTPPSGSGGGYPPQLGYAGW